MKIVLLNNYQALISKGIKGNSFVISRTSGLKYRVSKLNLDGTAACYRVHQDNGYKETDRYDFTPSEIDLIK